MKPNPRAPEFSQTAHDRVYRGLRTQIIHGQLHPGQALTLRAIAQEFEVSMTPAREALRRLGAEGAVTVSKSGRVATAELSNERIEELAALRALIEVELASRALPRAHLAHRHARSPVPQDNVRRHRSRQGGDAHAHNPAEGRFCCGGSD